MTVAIEWYDGPLADIRHLFEQAEDSAVRLDAYINLGRVLVATDGSPVAHLQLVVVADDPTALEIQSLAVVLHRRGEGLGRRLIERAHECALDEGFARLLVSTAAASTGNLRFYQRCAFRFLAIDRDAFTPATGYPDPISLDGVALCDRVWLDRQVVAPEGV